MKTASRAFVLLIVLIFLATGLLAQGNKAFTLTADSLKDSQTVVLNQAGWKYHPGDGQGWAAPQTDDSSWEVLKSSPLKLDSLPESGWNGVGWFRLRVNVDEALANKQLTFAIYHWGASEIYIDGKPVGKFGIVGSTPETEEAFNPNGTPMFFSFNGAGEHVIAVRHSVATLPELSSFRSRRLAKMSPLYGVGIFSAVSDSESAVLERESFLKLEAANRFGRAGLLGTIGLLFLLLYSFFPSLRANLYFAVFAFATVGNNLCNYLISTGHYDLTARLVIEVFFWYAWAVVNVSLLAFLYTSFFAARIPKYFWIIVAIWAVYPLGVLIGGDLPANNYLHSLILFVTVAEELRIMIYALKRKMSGAWIVGAGVLVFAALQFINALSGLNIESPEWIWLAVRLVSAIGITIAIAIYLARNFARLPKIEAENARRAKELDEARQLQLLMLPKSIPQLSNLEIAAYMKPATEVGGDYYDFHMSADGTLTIVVGDATGHGLKAGTVVTAAKALVTNLAEEASITEIFRQSSNALKKINLRGLYMAMTMIKVRNNQVSLSVAGMPSILIYRDKDKQVEEVSIKAMPLGSVANFPYKEHEFTLSAGDCIVVMSDGFPEMFNEADEILGFDKAAKILPEVAGLAPQKIINRFVEIGEQWAGARPAGDDVTFVVLKVKAGIDAN